MPDVRDPRSPVLAHEMAGKKIMERRGSHLPDVFDDPAAFLDGELHALVAIQGPDIRQHLIPDARFVVDVKRPPLLLGVAIGGFPLRQPLAPMLPPFTLRFNLDQYRLRIFGVGHAPQAIVDQEVGGVGIGLAVAPDKRYLTRLRDDFKDGEAEFLADNKVALKR